MAEYVIIGIQTTYTNLFMIIGCDGNFDSDVNFMHCNITEIPEKPMIIDAVTADNILLISISAIPRVISNKPIKIGLIILAGIKKKIFETNKSIFRYVIKSASIPIKVI